MVDEIVKCKRNHYRVPLQKTGPVTVLHHDGTQSPPLGEAQILDMSRGGCCLGFKHVHGEELEVNCRLRMEFSLGTARAMVLSGTVVWLKSGGEGICKLGVQFSQMSKETRSQIDLFLGSPGEHVDVEFAHGYKRNLLWRKLRVALLVVAAVAIGLFLVMGFSILDQRAQETEGLPSSGRSEPKKEAIDPALESLLKTYGEQKIREKRTPVRP